MSFRARVVTPPAPIVSFEEAKRRLRDLPSEDDRADVESMIAAASAHIDGPGGWLNRAVGRQTIELDVAGFDALACDLPWPDVASVDAVSYLDGTGARIALAAGSFEVLGNRLVPVIGTAWPAAAYALGDRLAVRVRYVTGYETVPAPIKAAVLMLVAAQFQDREGGFSVPPAVAALLAPYRVFA